MKKLFKNSMKILLVIMIVPLFGCSQTQKTTEDQLNPLAETLIPAELETLMPAETETLMPAETGNSQNPQNDSSWSQLGSFEGSNSVGKISVAPDGTLYVQVNNQDGIKNEDGSYPETFAKWNGLSWSKVDSEVGIGVGHVQHFTVTFDGIIYAIIEVRSNDPIVDDYTKISKWDGKNWVDLGKVDGVISVMQLDSNGALYVGGVIRSIGESGVTNVAKWDGYNWSAVGTLEDQEIWQIAITPSGILYVLSYDGNLLQWDGTAWTPIKLGPEIDASFQSIVVNFDGTLFTSGFQYQNDTNPAFIAKLENTVWSFIDTEFIPSGLHRLIGFSKNGILYSTTLNPQNATDDTYLGSVFSWDGTKWIYQCDVHDEWALSPVENALYTRGSLEGIYQSEIFQFKLKND